MTRVVIDNSDRDREIVALKAEQPHLSNDAIGQRYGISRERVRQVLSRNEFRKRRAASNERVAAKFRATFEMYEALRRRPG